MSALDLRAQLRASTERMHRNLVNDLNAIEEDKAKVCPGGVAHPAIRVVAECAAVNGMVANFLTSGEFTRPPAEAREAYYASFTTRQGVLDTLEQQTQTLLGAIDALDENTLGDIIPDTPLGPMSRFAVAQLPAMHMMYHDGQLNYIHTLNGDSAMHW